jgi:SH3 domain-containing YSC84-like protein 1
MMKTGEKLLRTVCPLTVSAGIILAISAVSFPVSAFAANDRTAANQLVEKSRMAFVNLASDPNLESLVDLVKKARGVFICPELLKGAFIVGVSGGSGVFLVRGEKTWYGPGFYTIGGASFGFQIGGQASSVILVAMTDRGVASFMSTSAKLGADAGVAVGPVGVGASAGTENLSADIISFSRSKGLYGGVSLDGAVIAVRSGLNDAYYGKKVSPPDIFVRHEESNPQAARLIEAVEKVMNP